jgi:hypothetical protein
VAVERVDAVQHREDARLHLRLELLHLAEPALEVVQQVIEGRHHE